MKQLVFIFVFAAVLALVAMGGCERKITNEVNNPSSNVSGSAACMTCHGDNDLTLVAAQAQWENSRHGIGETSVINANVGDGNCERCHTGEGFLAYLGVQASDSSHYSGIGCFTCHAPHTSGSLQVRTTAPYTLMTGETFDKGTANFCVNCHHSRRNVNTYVADSVKLSTHYGPHYSVQGDVLTGVGGYEYEGYTYRNSPHTTVTVDGCIDCHMSPSIGNFLGGHTWKMEAETVEGEMKNTVGCNTKNCHDGALEETFNYDGYVDSVEVLWEELGQELFARGLLQYESAPDDPVTHEDSLFVPKDQLIIKSKDTTGAIFNYMLVHEDGSEGVHNSKYIIDLLQSALNFITSGNPGVASKPMTLSAH